MPGPQGRNVSPHCFAGVGDAGGEVGGVEGGVPGVAAGVLTGGVEGGVAGGVEGWAGALPLGVKIRPVQPLRAGLPLGMH